MAVDRERAKVSTPLLEEIQPDFGQSFRFLLFEGFKQSRDPVWHYHPEIQLVYVKNGKGKRHIGTHISYYTTGDLILIGPNLPHQGFTDRLTKSDTEVVVQISETILATMAITLPELLQIQQLVKLSESGLSFYGRTKEYVGARLEDMAGMNTFERLIALLQIFQYLANSNEYRILNVDKVSLVINHQDHERIKTVYDYVRKNYMDPIPLDVIAEKIIMTAPSFCRYFKKHTNKTFTQYVNEFRIVHACKLLSEENTSVTNVAYDCGFNNFSHFSRCFKKQTGKTPREYRNDLRGVVIG